MDTIDLKVNQVLHRLRKARKQAGLSQGQAAKLLGYDSHASIVAVEKGETLLSVDRLLRLAEIYDVDEVWLLTGANPNFDRKSFMKAVIAVEDMTAQHREDLDNLASMLESLRQYPAKKEG